MSDKNILHEMIRNGDTDAFSRLNRHSFPSTRDYGKILLLAIENHQVFIVRKLRCKWA